MRLEELEKVDAPAALWGDVPVTSTPWKPSPPKTQGAPRRASKMDDETVLADLRQLQEDINRARIRSHARTAEKTYSLAASGL